MQDHYQDHIEEYQSYMNERYEREQADEYYHNNTDGQAIAGLILGIASIVTACCFGIGFVLGIVGLILSLSAQKYNRSGVVTAGIIVSVIGIILGFFGLLYFVLLIIGAVFL